MNPFIYCIIFFILSFLKYNIKIELISKSKYKMYHSILKKIPVKIRLHELRATKGGSYYRISLGYFNFCQNGYECYKLFKKYYNYEFFEKKFKRLGSILN